MTLKVEPAAQDAPKVRPAATPRAKSRRPILEILLDPRSIQWLLGIGGVLMVIGLVIWLASLGLFKNPKVLAISMGLGNALLLLGGGALVLRTRYRFAGQAVALLACVVAPLNLWFYHAQALMTVGGNLWMAAVGLCAIYAGVAWVLRDGLFVYALQAGLTLTLLLLMAEMGRATELLSLSLMLAGLGIVSIHVERAFPDGESPYSRRRFGMPFFWCGQAQLGAGLLALLLAQILAWLDWPGGDVMGYRWTALESQRVPAVPMALWVLATYAYLYSDVVVRRVGVYTFLAAFALLMAEMTFVQWRYDNPVALVYVLTVTALVVNLAREYFSAGPTSLRRALPPLGLSLTLLAMLLGLGLHIRATSQVIRDFTDWHYATDGWYVGGMLLLAATARLSAVLMREEKPLWNSTYIFVNGAALLITLAGLLRLLGLNAWHEQAPILMLVPIGYIVVAYLRREAAESKPLTVVAFTAAWFMLWSLLLHTFRTANLFERMSPANLWQAAFFAEACIFFLLAAIMPKRDWGKYIGGALACGCVWQVLAYFDPADAWYPVVFAGAGLVFLVSHRLTATVNSSISSLLRAWANGVLCVAFAASFLQGLSVCVTQRIDVLDLVAVGMNLLVSLIACVLVGSGTWRRVYVVMGIALAAVAFLMINVLADLTPWQKLRIFLVITGVIMLCSGYVARIREKSQTPDELAGLLLGLGSLLIVLPLFVAVLSHRFDTRPSISTYDELAMLTLSVLMLVTGYMLQFKAPTLLGMFALVSHLVILVIFVGMRAQVAIGVYLTIGGAALFGCGVALAVYREKLLLLPGRIAQRQGIFRILNWR